ncbi:hypothetical protein [Massilia sp. Dwa41.01b]|uniref:hypothetical protein n=1 Tax=Massilia sp. Dwa41.01b TaxID=2709302 RepID=UPI002805D03C|nr:hypothetical protein [Massilia sp. Dwa41.01b]
MKHALLIASACLLALLSTVGASLPYPILAPLFGAGGANGLTGFLGLPPELLLGLALMVNPLGLLLGSAVLGPVSDRLGRRRVLLATAIGGAIGHALTAAALALESYPLFPGGALRHGFARRERRDHAGDARRAHRGALAQPCAVLAERRLQPGAGWSGHCWRA